LSKAQNATLAAVALKLASLRQMTSCCLARTLFKRTLSKAQNATLAAMALKLASSRQIRKIIKIIFAIHNRFGHNNVHDTASPYTLKPATADFGESV
jgi:hypothetical protein